MRVIVFSGPSISRKRIEAHPGFEWRPPVSQGDVYQAAKTNPGVIAIVDGHFDGVPSVWHKEILWAMSRGIELFGASSMGALRAAELHQFGMHGVGEIFEKFRDGVFEDDDEVAVQHGPRELEYLSVNVPMVNVRATIDKACMEGVIDSKNGTALTAAAKSIFYPKRRWDEVLAGAGRVGADRCQLELLEKWLPTGQRDVKREDAERLLVAVQEFIDSEPTSQTRNFHFEWTAMWEKVFNGQTGASREQGDNFEANVESLIIDELRMRPELYRSMVVYARLKLFALREAGRKNTVVDDEQIRTQLKGLRKKFGLYSRAQLDDWMSRNDLSTGALQASLETQQKQQNTVAQLGELDTQILIGELRIHGHYESLKAAAEQTWSSILDYRDKKQLPNLAQLLVWYFETRLGESVPEDLDNYLAQLDLRSRDEFYRLLKNQYLTTLANKTESQ